MEKQANIEAGDEKAQAERVFREVAQILAQAFTEAHTRRYQALNELVERVQSEG